MHCPPRHPVVHDCHASIILWWRLSPHVFIVDGGGGGGGAVRRRTFLLYCHQMWLIVMYCIFHNIFLPPLSHQTRRGSLCSTPTNPFDPSARIAHGCCPFLTTEDWCQEVDVHPARVLTHIVIAIPTADMDCVQTRPCHAPEDQGVAGLIGLVKGAPWQLLPLHHSIFDVVEQIQGPPWWQGECGQDICTFPPA